MAEICRAFRNNGKCRNGDECKFEHSEGDSIEQPPRGECFNFQQTGECKFGDRCRFTHGPVDERFNEDGSRKKAERAPREGGGEGDGEKKKRPNRNRNRGEGKPREKIDEVCNKYQAGECRYGDRCRRQHVGDIPQAIDSA